MGYTGTNNFGHYHEANKWPVYTQGVLISFQYPNVERWWKISNKTRTFIWQWTPQGNVRRSSTAYLAMLKCLGIDFPVNCYYNKVQEVGGLYIVPAGGGGWRSQFLESEQILPSGCYHTAEKRQEPRVSKIGERTSRWPSADVLQNSLKLQKHLGQ